MLVLWHGQLCRRGWLLALRWRDPWGPSSCIRASTGGQEWRVSLMTSEARRVALQRHLVECYVWENPQVTWRELGASDGYADWVERVTRAG